MNDPRRPLQVDNKHSGSTVAIIRHTRDHPQIVRFRSVYASIRLSTRPESETPAQTDQRSSRRSTSFVPYDSPHSTEQWSPFHISFLKIQISRSVELFGTFLNV